MYHTKPEFTLPATGPVLLLLAVLLTAFFVGHVLTAVVRFLGGGTLPAWFQDIQAWFALIGLLLLGVVVIVRLVINQSLPDFMQLDLNVTETILAGVVVPTVNGTVADLHHIGAWIALGACLIAYAQVWLERL